MRLLTNADVRSVAANADGSTINHLEVTHGARKLLITATRYVVAAGAVNTAALLLRSRTPTLPGGIANSSGMVGRNYMAHPTTFVVGVRPGRENRLVFQKTLGINDWYHAGPNSEFPLGNVQALGKLQGWTIKSQRRFIPHCILEWMTQRSVDFLAESEDLPCRDSRVTVDEAAGPPGMDSDQHRIPPRTGPPDRTRDPPMRLPARVHPAVAVAASSHQCGTAAMGTTPSRAFSRRDCRAHDVENLWVVDSSVFPSSAAVNPALTIAANALRVADVGELTR